MYIIMYMYLIYLHISRRSLPEKFTRPKDLISPRGYTLYAARNNSLFNSGFPVLRYVSIPGSGMQRSQRVQKFCLDSWVLVLMVT